MSLRILDPAGLARVGNLELIAKQVVEGFLTGRHRSPYHGFSVEYLDHRAYSPGDELRSLDWKVLARTDKYYVKLFEDETNLRAYILLDCSRSMGFNSNGILLRGGDAMNIMPPLCVTAGEIDEILLVMDRVIGATAKDLGAE